MSKLPIKEFLFNLDILQRDHDKEIGRIQNRDAFSHKIRIWSRYLTYVFYKIGLHGPHILLLHFICDSIALYFVWSSEPILACVMWFTGHILDNSDGDLARALDEADPKWGLIDTYLHLLGNMVFWLILSVQVPEMVKFFLVLFASRVANEWLRQQKEYGDRYGERNLVWRLVVLPTDVNIMYLLYVICALLNALNFYIMAYALYLIASALIQGSIWLHETVRKTT